jgi:hypothetical protein
MKSLIARIVLRYLIGMLVMWALITSEVGEEFTRDPEVQMAIEGLIGGIMVTAVEVWTALSRRWGLKT